MTIQPPQPPADWEPDDDLGGSTFREESDEPVEPVQGND